MLQAWMRIHPDDQVAVALRDMKAGEEAGLDKLYEVSNREGSLFGIKLCGHGAEIFYVDLDDGVVHGLLLVYVI